MKTDKEVVFDLPVIKNLTLYNLTILSRAIKEFLKSYKKQTNYAVISLIPPGIHERIISLNIETPQQHHLQQEQNKALIWDYLPIGYNRKTGKTQYYACGITREQLFQYQLLALKAQINCIGILPQRIALLKATTHFFPESLETAMITNHASLQNYIQYSCDNIAFDTIFENTHLDKKTLTEHVGLFLLGKEMYEGY